MVTRLGFLVSVRVRSYLYYVVPSCTVNNVAIRYDHPQYFALLPHNRMWQLLFVNVTAPCVLSHMILPQMIDRRRGAIINVCSNIAAAPTTPLMAGYTACMVRE